MIKLATPPDRRVVAHIDRALRAAPGPAAAAIPAPAQAADASADAAAEATAVPEA